MVESSTHISELSSRIILQESQSTYYFDKYFLLIGFGSFLSSLFIFLMIFLITKIAFNDLFEEFIFITVIIIAIIFFIRYFIYNGINRKKIIFSFNGIILPFPHKMNQNKNFVPISDIEKIEIREEQISFVPSSYPSGFNKYGWNYLLLFKNGEKFLINNEIIGGQNQEKINNDIKLLISQENINYEVKMLGNREKNHS